MCTLVSLALLSASAAIKNLQEGRERNLPQEVYALFMADKEEAEFFLRSRDGYVAVYADPFFRKPIEVTSIEAGVLRKADRAMLRAGIPVRNKTELLRLLEDLGS